MLFSGRALDVFCVKRNFPADNFSRGDPDNRGEIRDRVLWLAAAAYDKYFDFRSYRHSFLL